SVCSTARSARPDEDAGPARKSQPSPATRTTTTTTTTTPTAPPPLPADRPGRPPERREPSAGPLPPDRPSGPGSPAGDCGPVVVTPSAGHAPPARAGTHRPATLADPGAVPVAVVPACPAPGYAGPGLPGFSDETASYPSGMPQLTLSPRRLSTSALALAALVVTGLAPAHAQTGDWSQYRQDATNNTHVTSGLAEVFHGAIATAN